MIHHSMKKKITCIQLITTLLIALIMGKLGYSQIIQNKYLSGLANEMWERSFPLEAPRGLIYDRNLEAIAMNLPVISVAVTPFQIKDKENTAEILGKILKVNTDVILNKISKKASIVKLYPEGKYIDKTQVEQIVSADLKGVYLLQDNKRYYPNNEYLAQTIGFVGMDNQGLAGLESYYEKYLKGTDGQLDYLMDAKGGLLNGFQSNVVSPVSGLNVTLTIDMEIQSVVERELSIADAKYSPESIMAIAMDPNSGEILAMSSRPSFNPNNYGDYSQEIYNRNLPIWKTYEPGSTFKVFSFAAALEEKKIDMHKDTYYDRGYEIVGGKTIKSWKKGGHGLQTYLEVLQNSSNPGFVEISRKLGKDTLYKYVKDFGFSTKTGIDMVGESSGIFFDYEKFGVLEQATTAFGQGVSVTPIQMVTGFSSLINGGKLMQPYILKNVTNPSTNDVLIINQPKVKKQVISKNTSDLMREALENVVAKGGGRSGFIDQYRVGGKTGTAQIAKNGVYLQGEYVLSFIAGMPMNDPKVVVYVALEKPKNTIQYGGTVAAPIVKNMLNDIIKIMDIPPQSGQIDRTLTWMDQETVVVPNYIGVERAKVKNNAYFKFVIYGSGSKVIDQIPKNGTRVPSGSTIMVMLGD